MTDLEHPLPRRPFVHASRSPRPDGRRCRADSADYAARIETPASTLLERVTLGARSRCGSCPWPSSSDASRPRRPGTPP